MQKVIKIIFAILFISHVCSGLEYNKRGHNVNSDFLIHEAGENPAGRIDVISSVNLNKQTQINQQSSGKRDYVSQFPSLGSPQPTSPNQGLLGTTPKSFSASGKPDYVDPQLPSSKPLHDSTGKVKDLINLFDSKNTDQNAAQKPQSYSSVLGGTNGHNKPSTTTLSVTRFTQPITQSTPNVFPNQTRKPLSFSAVVGAPSKPSSPFTTSKPSTSPNNMPVRPVAIGGMTPRPSMPVLPSSVVNGNRNNNQGPNNNINGVYDNELQTLSEELLRKDSNNAAKYITINFQEKTTSHSQDDRAPQPLITTTSEVWNIPTVQKFVPLLDNYERDTLVNEHVTPQERNEENAFMDSIMSTSVIRHLMNFLKDKGFVTPDPRQQRDFLKQLWFSLYSRGKGKISSSGFEHIFVSELKNGGVSGLHNWIYFSREESANRLNYLGYLKYLQLNDKGAVMKLHFSQQGVDKPVNSMFVGTSPELEIALYTLCFVTRADNDCKLKLGNKDVEIVSHTFRYRSKNLIGSAYPQI